MVIKHSLQESANANLIFSKQKAQAKILDECFKPNGNLWQVGEIRLIFMEQDNENFNHIFSPTEGL